MNYAERQNRTKEKSKRKKKRNHNNQALADHVPIYASDHLLWCIITYGKSAEREQVAASEKKNWKEFSIWTSICWAIEWLSHIFRTCPMRTLSRRVWGSLRTYCGNNKANKWKFVSLNSKWAKALFIQICGSACLPAVQQYPTKREKNTILPPNVPRTRKSSVCRQ